MKSWYESKNYDAYQKIKRYKNKIKMKKKKKRGTRTRRKREMKMKMRITRRRGTKTKRQRESKNMCLYNMLSATLNMVNEMLNLNNCAFT